MNEYLKIGARIKELRVSKDISQNTLAEGIGITRSLLAQIERSNTKPTLEILYKLVRYFNTTYDFLIEGKSITSNGYKEFIEQVPLPTAADHNIEYFTNQHQKEPTVMELKDQIDMIIKRLDRNKIN